jgi:hypothetical protein
MPVWISPSCWEYFPIYKNQSASFKRKISMKKIYIYSPNEENLSILLSKAINHFCDQGILNLIADLINEHRPFDPVYLKL